MRRLGRLAAAVLVLSACGGTAQPPPVPGADAARGKTLIERYGCGGCHTISGIAQADSHFGPDLRHFRDKGSIAGQLPNSVANVIRWIMDPQRVEPGTLMPDLGVTRADARDIVAYLYGQ